MRLSVSRKEKRRGGLREYALGSGEAALSLSPTFQAEEESVRRFVFLVFEERKWQTWPGPEFKTEKKNMYACIIIE